MGFLPWLALMTGIFWLGIKIENNDRVIAGRQPYSGYDAGRDFAKASDDNVYRGRKPSYTREQFNDVRNLYRATR